MKKENKLINNDKKHKIDKLSKPSYAAESPAINKNKIIFDDDGNAVKAPLLTAKQQNIKKSKQKSFDTSINNEKNDEIGKKWYYEVNLITCKNYCI